MTEKNKRDIGKEGEDIASDYLSKKGFRIIERNYHFRHGEIDIVARDKNQLVFIEVKTRLNLEYGEPEYAIDAKKIQQIKKMAKLYLYDKKIDEVECRFDVVAVVLGEGSGTQIKHFQNEFI